MSSAHQILFKIVVKPYYRENTGLFVFLFTMMFFIVNKVDGAELLEYHYSLILGTLKSGTLLVLVFAAWLLYTRKCIAYITNALHQPEYAFLHLFNSLPKSKRFLLFLRVEVWLLLPILLYAVAMITIGLNLQFYVPVLCIICFFILVVCAAAATHLKHLKQPLTIERTRKQNLFRKHFSSYPFLLLGYVGHHQKALWIGIKVFTCGLLYLIARNNTALDYDNQPVFLFFSFGIIAHSVLVYRVRAYEENYLSFYRGLAVTRLKRFLHYAFVYALLLVPEFITLGLLTPIQLHVVDAVNFTSCGYGFILLMNSITFIQHTSMKEFLKMLSLFFFVQYLFLLTVGLTVLSLLLFALAVLLFWVGYWKYEVVK